MRQRQKQKGNAEWTRSVSSPVFDPLLESFSSKAFQAKISLKTNQSVLPKILSVFGSSHYLKSCTNCTKCVSRGRPAEMDPNFVGQILKIVAEVSKVQVEAMILKPLVSNLNQERIKLK